MHTYILQKAETINSTLAQSDVNYVWRNIKNIQRALKHRRLCIGLIVLPLSPKSPCMGALGCD